MTNPSMEAQCCVVGGGPAGMMLGYLLARNGIDVLVLEKHADFLRDFRGDTVHPSTLELLAELGLIEAFLKLPHQELRQVTAHIGDRTFRIADFTRLKTTSRFIAFMPQWDFLQFLADKAKALPNFRLLMETEATGLRFDGERVTGVVARGDEGAVEIAAKLVVAADGRSSVLRAAAGLTVHDLGAPIDVLWFKVGRGTDAVAQTFGRLDAGHFMVTIDRGDYWQCAYVIAKGGADRIKATTVDGFKRIAVAAAPYLADHIDDIKSWDDLKLLSVAVDRLERWSRDGLLCIGDAAHAMSPVGGVGINMAIQDAVAAANILARHLKSGAPSGAQLDQVRRRRLLPTKIIQGFQVMIQNRVLVPTLAGRNFQVPLAVKLIDRWPVLQGLAARFVGVGIRPEHVEIKRQ